MIKVSDVEAAAKKRFGLVPRATVLKICAALRALHETTDPDQKAVRDAILAKFGVEL